MNQDQIRDQIATVVAVCHGFEQPAQFDHEVAARVWAKVVAPLLADRDAKHEELMANRLAVLDECVAELARTRGKLGEAQGNHWAARERLEQAELEITRLRREVEFEANGTMPVLNGLSLPVCACLPPGAELPAGWSLPQCSVHPDRGGNDD